MTRRPLPKSRISPVRIPLTDEEIAREFVEINDLITRILESLRESPEETDRLIMSTDMEPEVESHTFNYTPSGVGPGSVGAMSVFRHNLTLPVGVSILSITVRGKRESLDDFLGWTFRRIDEFGAFENITGRVHDIVGWDDIKEEMDEEVVEGFHYQLQVSMSQIAEGNTKFMRAILEIDPGES